MGSRDKFESLRFILTFDSGKPELLVRSVDLQFVVREKPAYSNGRTALISLWRQKLQPLSA